ncbi:hypothetical protein Tco_0888169, partial [Tanacetum coccineum]
MMIVYGRHFVDEHRDFALRVNRLIGDMRVACEDRVAFVQGALECGGKDLRLAREINALCDRLTIVVDEREAFVDELDMLPEKYVPGNMVGFTKQVQNKDIPNLMKLQILRREFELRVQENELFIEKLK